MAADGHDGKAGCRTQVAVALIAAAAAVVVAWIEQPWDEGEGRKPELTINWDLPQNGDTTPICFDAAGTLSDDLPSGQVIVLGNKGAKSDRWQFRYDNVSLGADNRTWRASWTLGSRSNPVPGDYTIVVFLMSESRAHILSKGTGKWTSSKLPEEVTGTAQITVHRTSDQRPCPTPDG